MPHSIDEGDIHTHGLGGTEDITTSWTNPGTYGLLLFKNIRNTMPYNTIQYNVISLKFAQQKFHGCLEFTQSRLPRFGTTSFLASTICPCGNHVADIGHTLDALKRVYGRVGVGAVCEGIHSEGPIVADLGALPPGDVDLSLEDFIKLLDK